MIPFIILAIIAILYFFANLKKKPDDKTRLEKTKMEFYNRIHTTTEPHIQSNHLTTKN
jgi:hypothetical protein